MQIASDGAKIGFFGTTRRLYYWASYGLKIASQS